MVVRDIRYESEGVCFEVVEGDAVALLQTKLMGAYNVSNLLGVMAAMRSLGIPLLVAVRACALLHPVPGRMECLGEPGAPLVVVDYAHTPDALAQALTALRPLAERRGGKLWCVFGCGGYRDASKRPLMGAIAASMVGSIFSSDAWNNVTFIAGEMKNPKRNIGLSLFLGTLIVTVIYVSANLMYLNVLPLNEVAFAADDRVAVAAALMAGSRCGCNW